MNSWRNSNGHPSYRLGGFHLPPLPLANPRLPRTEVEAASQFLLGHSEFRGHLALATSGSSIKSGRKWALLSKAAILKSAEAVNFHLRSHCEDRWLLALPTFHVGGLSIYARAHLTGAEVIPMPMVFSASNSFCFLGPSKSEESRSSPSSPLSSTMSSRAGSRPRARCGLSSSAEPRFRKHFTAAHSIWVGLAFQLRDDGVCFSNRHEPARKRWKRRDSSIGAAHSHRGEIE